MSLSLVGKHCAAVDAGRSCGPAVDVAGFGLSHGGTSVGGDVEGGDFGGGDVEDGEVVGGEADVAVGAGVAGGSPTATSA